MLSTVALTSPLHCYTVLPLQRGHLLQQVPARPWSLERGNWPLQGRRPPLLLPPPPHTPPQMLLSPPTLPVFLNSPVRLRRLGRSRLSYQATGGYATPALVSRGALLLLLLWLAVSCSRMTLSRAASRRYLGLRGGGGGGEVGLIQQ